MKFNLKGLATLGCLWCAFAAYADRTAKAVFNSDTLKLTFYCDEVDHSGDNVTVYPIQDNGQRTWGDCASTVTQAVFDASFCYFQTKTLGSWFSEMDQLQEIIGAENIDTSLATSMGDTFRNNHSLKVVDMSAWVCTNITDVSGAYKSTSLTTVYVAPDFSWSPNIAEQSAFSYTWDLIGGSGSKWGYGYESVRYAKIDGGSEDVGFFTSKAPTYSPFVRKVVLSSTTDSSATINVNGFRLCGGKITATINQGGVVCDTKEITDFGSVTFTGLSSATAYQIDVLAENDYGTSVKNGLEFMTLDDPSRRWFYDVDAGVISNANWRFAATVAKGTRNLTVGAVAAWPDEVTALDFSGQVADKNGLIYTIVNLNPEFGEQTSGTGWRPKGKSPQCERVGALTLPKTLQALSNYAFTQCANMVLVGGIPATVTTIGEGVFRGVSLTGDLVLTNVTTVGMAAFKETQITSVKFGPGLTSFTGNYDRGCFAACYQLTNVIFDADSSWSSGYYMFVDCWALKTLDLKGIVIAVDHLADDSAVTKVIFSEKLNSVLTNTFVKMSSLSTVEFEGAPPSSMETPLFSQLSDDKTITTYVPYKKLSEKNSADKCWLDYAANGKIEKCDTTWASDYTGGADVSKRPLLTIPPLGFLILVR